MKRLLPLLLLLAIACSDDDDKSAASTTTTSVSTTTTSSTATTAAPSEEDACFTFDEVDRGASVTVFGVFDCDGVPLELDGADAAFPVGGTVTHAEGLRCEDDALVVLAAQSDDGETYQASEKTYLVQDGSLVLDGETGSTITAAEVQPYYEIDC